MTGAAVDMPIRYEQAGMSKLELALTAERLEVRAPLKNADIPLASLKGFCLVPTAQARPANPVASAVFNRPEDLQDWDAELVLAWEEEGRRHSRRLLIKQAEPQFQAFRDALAGRCPAADLTGLDPEEAQRRMGVMSTQRRARTLAIAAGVVLAVAIAAYFLLAGP